MSFVPLTQREIISKSFVIFNKAYNIINFYREKLVISNEVCDEIIRFFQTFIYLYNQNINPYEYLKEKYRINDYLLNIDMIKQNMFKIIEYMEKLKKKEEINPNDAINCLEYLLAPLV